ncbi:MAG: bile acid:sodium symporter family protein [Saprospiraceae bacterium]
MTQDLDHIIINFDHTQILVLNVCLGILMFGVALELKLSDFKYIIQQPKVVIGGMVSQWILLPVLTIGLIYLIRPDYSLALGMILIAACPGGNVSNYAVHLAGANAALSVVLTMVTTVMCAVSTPFIFRNLKKLLPLSGDEYPPFDIAFLDMLSTIGQLILIPLTIGFLFTTYLPVLTCKIKGVVKKVSFLIFIGFVIAAVSGNLDNLYNYVYIVFFIVLVHNGLALVIGYYWSEKILRLTVNDCRAISIETGIQNSGLALILIFNFFDGLGGMALIAAWWSIWHLLSSLALAWWWKFKVR